MSGNGRADRTGDEGRLVEARGLLLAGELDGLSRLIDEGPELVTHRFASVEIPYDGYFHGATLLHHVAANPFISELPGAIGEICLMLLDRGAEVDAVTRQGPSQPDDIGWTTLGLVATSAEARAAGHQRALLDILLDAGADLDARNGGCLMGALYYGESEAAEYLAQQGARLDLIAAAGVGDADRMRELLATRPDADRLTHYSQVAWPTDAGERDLLGVALIYAALHGRLDAIRTLLEAGAEPDHRPPFDHGGTALHWAVLGDRPESVRALLDAGADPTLTDRSFDSTPLGWAEHLGRAEAEAALRSG